VRATWEVQRIQQNGFCEFPASRKLSYEELYFKMIYFSQNCRIRNKNDVKNDFSVGDLMGWTPDQNRKEYGKFIFLFNRKLSCLGINDAHSDSSYSLN